MSFIESAKSVIATESNAITQLLDRIDGEFTKACEIIKACKGRVVVLGIGKSGHIGNKIAATLASTGTPAFAVNAGEASHGDFGMITNGDVIIAISNSGKTFEIVRLLPLLKRLAVPLISLTGDPESELAKAADANLDVSIEKEACPLALAPTASTTATLVMGDALAIALMEARGFTKEQFAFSHPGGALGNRLLLTVADVMHTADEIPTVTLNANLHDAIVEITQKRLGFTTVVDDKGQLLGIYTDGDLRRTFEKGLALNDTKMSEVMSPHPVTMTQDRPALEAFELMKDKKITALVVCDQDKKIDGVLHMHDLIRLGVAS